jgi:hypothetical protein
MQDAVLFLAATSSKAGIDASNFTSPDRVIIF